MTTIVMNTLTGAVTEYSGFDFQSITPTHAGSTLGLYEFGGDTDIDIPIVASVVTGKTLWSDIRRKFMDAVYFAMAGNGTSSMSVITPDTEYDYPFEVRPNGVSRAKPGRGIRENYLAFGYSNTDGANFRLDQIEVPQNPSKNRKV